MFCSLLIFWFFLSTCSSPVFLLASNKRPGLCAFYVWLGVISIEQVDKVNGDDVVCVIKNTATLTGALFTLHASQIRIDLPTLTDKDKEVSLRSPSCYYYVIAVMYFVIKPHHALCFHFLFLCLPMVGLYVLGCASVHLWRILFPIFAEYLFIWKHFERISGNLNTKPVFWLILQFYSGYKHMGCPEQNWFSLTVIYTSCGRCSWSKGFVL